MGRDAFRSHRRRCYPRPDDVHRHVTWRDNKWFPPGLEEERRIAKETEPERHEHVWEGQPDDGDATKKVLSRALLEACVEAFRRSLAPPDDQIAGYRFAGYGHADGGGASYSLTIREGPVIRRVKRWPGVAGDPRPAVRKAHAGCVEAGVRRLFYDANSPLRGIFLAVLSEDQDATRYAVRSQHFGGEVLGPDVLFEIGRPNKKVFSRWNVQSAFAVRLRAQRTVRLLRGDSTVSPRNALGVGLAWQS